mmetsp:Transcript_10699/g.19761  ORF Transcript_10699/g.19761 Transcript_10699/m.19761 type:complete len:203 (-) Transcript_10699:397-1005(-)
MCAVGLGDLKSCVLRIRGTCLVFDHSSGAVVRFQELVVANEVFEVFQNEVAVVGAGAARGLCRGREQEQGRWGVGGCAPPHGEEHESRRHPRGSGNDVRALEVRHLQVPQTAHRKQKPDTCACPVLRGGSLLVGQDTPQQGLPATQRAQNCQAGSAGEQAVGGVREVEEQSGQVHPHQSEDAARAGDDGVLDHFVRIGVAHG